MSDDALLLKLCDRLDNVHSLKQADEDFKTKYSNETWEIIHRLLCNRKLNEQHISLIKDIQTVLTDTYVNIRLRKIEA